MKLTPYQSEVLEAAYLYQKQTGKPFTSLEIALRFRPERQAQSVGLILAGLARKELLVTAGKAPRTFVLSTAGKRAGGRLARAKGAAAPRRS